MTTSTPDSPFTLVAVTTFGLEAVAARELEALGYPKVRDGVDHGPGRVYFEGGAEAIARAGVFVRTAERVQILVSAFDAPDFDALFDGARTIPWEDWLPPGAAFPVRGRSVRSQLSSVPAVQRTVKRAIVDRLLSVRHPGASDDTRIDESGPEFRVEIALLDNRASILLDTTGPGMNKRGYRDRVGEAQLRETLAAAVVLLSRWTPDREMIDPFCGTGTIAIEAAMIARDLAPGRHRPFAAEAWPWVPARVWTDARTEADDRARPACPARIIATDRDPQAIELARRHAERAGVSGDIHVQQRDFRDLASKTEYGVVVTNPPYGHRLGDRRELDSLYASFPAVLARLPTWSASVLTGYPGFEKAVGRSADKRRKLFNARVEATLYQFDGPPPPRDSREDRDDREDREDRDSGSARHHSESAAFVERDTEPHPSTDAFVNRVAKMAHHRRRWPETEGTDAYRVYQRDLPDVPLHVDRFGDRWVITQVGRPRIAPEVWRPQIEMLSRALARRLEVDRSSMVVRADGVRASPVTLRFREGPLAHEVRCRPEGAIPFRFDLRQARAWLTDLAADAGVLLWGDRDGSLALASLAGGASAVLADPGRAAQSRIDAGAQANGLALKGRLINPSAPGASAVTASLGVLLCPRDDDVESAVAVLHEFDASLTDDARVLLVTGPGGDAEGAVADAIDAGPWTWREHTKKTATEDAPGWHRSWMLERS